MSLSHGILGFLNYGSMSGYDLAKAFHSSVNFFWHAQNSQIYLELDKLEKKGMVVHELIVQTDKPNKKLYSVTDKGREEFLSWLDADDPDETAGIKSAFLMKVFFSGARTRNSGSERIEKFASDCRRFMESMKTIPRSLDEYGKYVSDNNSLYWKLTADFGYRYCKMCMEWAENCLVELEKKE